jgi:hypothetical protein
MVVFKFSKKLLNNNKVPHFKGDDSNPPLAPDPKGSPPTKNRAVVPFRVRVWEGLVFRFWEKVLVSVRLFGK